MSLAKQINEKLDEIIAIFRKCTHQEGFIRKYAIQERFFREMHDPGKIFFKIQ